VVWQAAKSVAIMLIAAITLILRIVTSWARPAYLWNELFPAACVPRRFELELAGSVGTQPATYPEAALPIRK
jgi:hypothetical protein